MYFLEKFRQYIAPLADTLCYCLMPNHFHFLVRIKSREVVLKHLSQRRSSKGLPLANFPSDADSVTVSSVLHLAISKEFSNFLNAYAKAFNKAHNRLGHVYMHVFKRKLIDDRNYLLRTVLYIHKNPVVAGLCDHPAKWPYSSYSATLRLDDAFQNAAEVIEYFGDVENFRFMHENVEKVF